MPEQIPSGERKNILGKKFGKYKEGEILDHIKANPTKFSSTILRVIEDWYQQSEPELA